MAGNILRGRVGGAPDYENESRSGGVLRARVGSLEPRQVARQLRDALGETDSDEDIDAADQQLEAQGVPPEQRIERYAEHGKGKAVQHYAATKDPSTAERVFALVGDIANGLRGGDNTGLSRGLRQRYDAQNKEAEARAQAEQDESAEAEYIEGLLRSSGYQTPEGGARSNPRAFTKVFGPVVGDSLKNRRQDAENARKEQIEQQRYDRGRQDRVEDREDAQTARSQEAALRREEVAAGREDARDARNTDRLDTEQRKISAKKEDQAREIEEFARNVYDNIAALDAQIDEQGTYEMLGPENQDFERRVNQIAVGLAKLADPGSVAREGEVSLARRGLPEPGLGTRNSTARQVLQNLKAEVEKRRQLAYRVRGLQDPSGAAPAEAPRGDVGREGSRKYLGDSGASAPRDAPSAGAPAATSQKVRVRLPDGRTGSIPASQLEAAKAKGAVVVQ